MEQALGIFSFDYLDCDGDSFLDASCLLVSSEFFLAVFASFLAALLLSESGFPMFLLQLGVSEPLEKKPKQLNVIFLWDFSICIYLYLTLYSCLQCRLRLEIKWRGQLISFSRLCTSSCPLSPPCFLEAKT